MSKDFLLSKEEFDDIYGKVPRLTVEILIQNNRGIYLTKRTVDPCKGQWHLPGGTVRFGESLISAVRRIAQRELGIDVIAADNIGVIEYPSHYLNDLDSPVGLVFKVINHKGEPAANSEAIDAGWFKKAPSPLHADQDEFLINKGLLA